MSFAWRRRWSSVRRSSAAADGEDTAVDNGGGDHPRRPGCSWRCCWSCWRRKRWAAQKRHRRRTANPPRRCSGSLRYRPDFGDQERATWRKVSGGWVFPEQKKPEDW